MHSSSTLLCDNALCIAVCLCGKKGGRKKRKKEDQWRLAVAVADEELLDGDVDGAACEGRGIAEGTGSADDARTAQVVSEALDLLIAQNTRTGVVRLFGLFV